MRILTGIQSSGEITLGNYLGSIKNFQKEVKANNESFIFIANHHSLTTKPKPEILRNNIQKLMALYMAMGIEQKSTIFLQSQIKEHTELAWILQCHTAMGELNRMTQYKDKSMKNENPSVALFTYPVLMAADILLYQADIVPVGEDQKQHLELTRDLAERFNKFYQEDIFKIPEPEIKKSGAKIYSLTDPTQKMSKSDENPKSYISMLDQPEVILKKIKSATTDSLGQINFDPINQPGVSNLLTIYTLCKDTNMTETLNYFKDKQYGFLKQEVAEAIITELKPIQQKYEEIYANPDLIKKELKKGQEVAQKIAQQTIEKVNQIIGYEI